MAARLLYKSMLRTARELQLDGKTLKLQASADPAMWGHGKPHTRNVSLRSLFPSLKTEVSGEALNGAELAEVVRSEFRAQQHIDAVEDSLVDEGFAALRILHQQIALQGCTSDTVTEGVRVEATSGFIPESSNPDAGHFLFTYCITISNTGSNVVRLLGRQWDIVDESGELVAQVPKGSQGVVGHTPILNPGESFQYSSGAALPTARGRMQGSFQMVQFNENEDEIPVLFDAHVNAFGLNTSVRASPVQ